MDHRHCIRINKVFTTAIIAQIDADQFAGTAQIFDDSETVAEIVGHEKRVAVRTDRDACGVDWRAIAVVTRRVGRESKTTDVDEWSFDRRVWTRRCGSNRSLAIGLKPKYPDLVFKAAGNVQRVRTVF